MSDESNKIDLLTKLEQSKTPPERNRNEHYEKTPNEIEFDKIFRYCLSCGLTTIVTTTLLSLTRDIITKDPKTIENLYKAGEFTLEFMLYGSGAILAWSATDYLSKISASSDRR